MMVGMDFFDFENINHDGAWSCSMRSWRRPCSSSYSINDQLKEMQDTFRTRAR